MIDRGCGSEPRSSLVADGVTLLRPEETVFEEMLEGWGAQQRSRSLSIATVTSRVSVVRRFAGFTGEWPWQWASGDVEEWAVYLRSHGVRANGTLRGYQQALAMFCAYLIDPRYPWAAECVQRFGTHPVQICHEWNTTRHTAQFEGNPRVRALTLDELQRFFDYCDQRVEEVRRLGRKGWMAAYRDSALFKTMYAFGLRRREAVMLDVADLRPNPKAPVFGQFGKCEVRFGKSRKGSVPQPRTVLTVFPWSSQVLADYLENVRPRYQPGQMPALWLTERGTRLSVGYVTERFAAYRDAVGLPQELHPHCLRHSYVSHLTEKDWDATFIQRQVGHAWASTTAIYTSVSPQFMNSMLATALQDVLDVEEEE